MNLSNTQMLIGFPIVGALGGLGLGTLNQNYSQNLYGNSSNDPFIGASWDFVLTGASIGGGVALASAGIKYQAQQLKLQRQTRMLEDSFGTSQMSDMSKRLLAMSGKF